jgi:hypothetical protein
MGSKRVLIGALAVAGALVVGTAVTATSTIYDGSAHVGSVLQTVAGVTVNDVNYTYVPGTDTTEEIDVVVEQLLDEVAGTLQVSVNAGGYVNCDAPVQTDVNTNGADDGAMDFTDVNCDIADTPNVTSVRFLVQEQ